MKFIINLLKKTEFLSSVAIRMTKLTGKSKVPLHPKHLIRSNIWFAKFLKESDFVLDLGCNSGQASLRIASQVKKVIGLDINSNLIGIAKEQALIKKIKNVNFLVGDANDKLQFKDNSFDKVICSDVLEHLYNRDLALAEIKRVLRTKGLLFLVTDNPHTSWKRLQKSQGLFYYADRDHKYEYSKEEILKKLKMRKFRIISVDTVTYDTPLKGLIDLTGGISLELYKRLGKWRQNMVKKHPENTTGYKIIAQKI